MKFLIVYKEDGNRDFVVCNFFFYFRVIFCYEFLDLMGVNIKIVIKFEYCFYD